MLRHLKLICFILFIGLAAHVSSQDAYPIKIGILRNDKIRSASFNSESGEYELIGDGKKLKLLQADDRVSLAPKGELVNIKLNGTDLGSFRRIVMKGIRWESTFRLTYTNSAGTSKKRLYDDHLIVRSASNHLTLINEIELEHYVSGVAEAEAGTGHDLEYYKVQTIISRTYALANLHRHNAEGFNLCDQVHCQAYKGKATHDANIVMAAYATKGHVLVDANINYITAAFHSNCGGHTVNAEDVWSKPVSYLVGRPDTFCLSMPNSHWEKILRKDEWHGYFTSQKDKELAQLKDSLSRITFFPGKKPVFFGDSLRSIKMTKLRHDFKLKSAYFSVYQTIDSVHLTGRGFGHGVGLCQEGAIRMAQLGFKCSEILHFYYKDVHLIDKENLIFFRDENVVH